jgi:uncharacterized protein DUF2330
VLRKLTEPETKQVPRPSGGGGIACGCSKSAGNNLAGAMPPPVQVLQEKMVAGFHAVVLEATSATALVSWLKDHGYAFSPEVKAWAEPYVEGGWKITALKVAKGKDGKEHADVAASALRLTSKTDRPLFPYREPDSKSAADKLEARHRLLRIYFLAVARYQGKLTQDNPWTGSVAWAGKINSADRKKILELLKLPETTGPADWWLTEFEDDWPYRMAPADVLFSRDPIQEPVKRQPILQYVSSPWPRDFMVYAIALVVVVPPLLRRARRGRKT